MSLPLRIRPQAEADLEEATRWYEASGVSHRFVEVVDRTLERIAEHPTRYPKVEGEVRRVLTGKFPYAIFYIMTTDAVEILAVLHQATDPHRWRKRTTDP